ncbi:MAG: DUF3107 domain-containing protein [Candidatus Planktophila sp.]
MSTKKNEKASRVRIAVSEVASELSFECPSTPAEIKSAVTAALSANTPLILTDIRGHEIVVPASKIGYIEIGEPVERRVGFGVN